MFKRLKSNTILSWFCKSFSRKIMSILLISMSLVTGFVSIVYYHSTIDILQKEYIKSNKQLLAEVSQTVNRYYDQLDSITQSLYRNTAFIDNLRRHQEDYSALSYNEHTIKSILYSDDAIQYIYFYEPYSKNLYSYSRENMSYISFPKLEQEEWYQRTLNDDRFFYISPLHKFINYTNFGTLKDEEVFSVNRAIRYYSTGEIIGMISMNYDTSYLEKICQNLISPNGYTAILDEDLAPRLSTYPDNLIPDNIIGNIKQSDSDNGYYKYTMDGTSRILLWNSSDGLYLLKDIPFKELSQNAVIVSRITFSFSAIVFILSLFIAFYFSRSVTYKLKMLTRDISAFGNGNLSINANDYGTDEIGTLARAFNDMTEKINELINLEYKAKVLKKSAELRALQAQIKPHFINNTLQALGTLGLKKGAVDVYYMANALAKMLRYTLKSSTELVPLETEIENMDHYLYIQKILWNDRLKVDLQVDKAAENRLVPVFILQPLVENAIKHGFDDSMEGMIHIEITLIDSSLSIKVEDNGRGIPSASLKMLKEWLNEYDELSDSEEHTGIRNIVGRIRLIYGTETDFTIDSHPGEGTCIHIILPDKEHKDV